MAKYSLPFILTFYLVLTLCRTAAAQPEIPHIASADLPAIDGDLSDWEPLFAAPHLTQSHFLSNYGEFQGRVPEADQKIEVWLGWNDETDLLYLAARVTDNAFGTTTSDDPTLVWRSDDLEVYIDADYSGGSYDSANAQAQQYVLNPAGKHQAVLFPLSLQNPPKVVSAAQRSGTTYTYELSIPGWDSIDPSGTGIQHDFQGNQLIGLMIAFADFEGVTEADAGQYHAFNALYGAVDAWKNANRFTAFRLKAVGAAPARSRVFALPKFSQPPVLDGVRGAAEWAGALEMEGSVSQITRDGAAFGWRDRENQVSEVSANQLQQSAGEEAAIARTDADAFAHLWYAWDEEALYYLAEVRDNVHDVVLGSDTRAWFWWERDSISLYLDLTNTKEKAQYPGPYTALNIVNFAAAAPYSGTIPISFERTWERTIDSQRSFTSDPDLTHGMEYGYRAAGNEFGGAADYVIEGKIPWAVLRKFNLPATPTVGTQMGFSWLLVDPDGEEGYGGQLQGGGLVDDPSTYSTWVFVDTPAGPAPAPSPPDLVEGEGIVPLSEPPTPVTLVSAQKYATLQEALDKERALYIPPDPSGGHYELNESLVIEGGDDVIIAGSGRRGNSGTHLFFKGDHGLRIHNCRRLTLYNLSLVAWETGPEGAVIEITGDEPCEIHLVDLLIGEVIPGTTRGAALGVRAPAQVIIERCSLGGVDVGLEVDHPEANVVLVGGSVWARALCVRQLTGHLEAYSLDVGNTYDLPDGVDFEFNRASWKPFVIAGARTERSALGIRTPDTSERIDLIVKGFCLPDEKLYDYGFLRYGAEGTVALIGNASTRGKIEVPTGAGSIWSVGNHLGRAYEVGEPYQLNREAQGFALADLWQRVPEGKPEPLSAFITPEELQARNRPVPENLQFLTSGATVPYLNTPSALQIADVPIIANIAESLPSVKDYGARGDGVADDTEALQRALDANQGPYSAPTLFFPAGVYRISRSLQLENRSYGGWWVGAGKDLTTITNTAGGGVVRTNGCGYATFQDLAFVAVEGGSEPVFDLFLDRQRNPERQGIQANLFARCRFVGGTIGLSIAQGEFTMGSENMAIDCEFIRCKVGLEVGNFNALNNNVRRCLFQDNEVALSQQAGSFYVFDSRLERSKDTDLYIRHADCFYVQNTTSDSPSLLRTPNTGAVVNVVFDNFHYLGDQPTNLISYNAGGSVVFLDSDLGKGFLSGAGAIANKSIVLAGTSSDLPNVLNLYEGAQGFLLNFSAKDIPAPSRPVLISPPHLAKGVKTYPTLWWQRSTGATTYRLQVATASSFAAPVVDQRGLTNPFYAADGLKTATAYYWRVSAISAGDTSAWSQIWRFTTSATGDFDGSGKVDFGDFFLFADAFGSTDPRFDLDNSGRVEFADFFFFADLFGSEARAKLMALAQEYLGLPVAPRLEQNYPNPFNNSTVIRYQVAAPGVVRLDIFSLTGQKVKTLVQRFQAAGVYQISWDGDDEQGAEVSTGIYLARFQVGDLTEVRKMLLMK